MCKATVQRARKSESVSAVMSLSWRGRARLLGKLLSDHRVPLPARAVLPLLVAYLLIPVDIVPDFIPVLGQADDILALLLALWAFNRLAGPRLVVEIAQELNDREGHTSRAERRDDDSGRPD